jgi:hypothetical protein
MLATFGGFLALALGLSVLLLPLLVTELSRPRDSVWGAVVLLLGLVLVTSAERLTGAPMLAVLCGGLLIGRLGTEVGQARWRALSDEERRALLSSERWSRSVAQLGASAVSLLEAAAGVVSGLAAWRAQSSQGRSKGKRWVRAEVAEGGSAASPATEPVADPPAPAPGSAAQTVPEPAGSDPERLHDPEVADPPAQRLVEASAQAVEPPAARSTADGPGPDGGAPDEAMTEAAGVPVVSDFSGIDGLLEAAGSAAPAAETAPLPDPEVLRPETAP